MDYNSEKSNEFLFMAEFSDGYTFRNLIEYLKGTNTHGNFEFSPLGITYCRSDASNTVLNDILIRAHDLTYFQYNSKDEKIIVGLTIANLRSVTKSIGKGDSIRIYMLPDDHLLYLKIISHNAKALSGDNVVFVRPQMIEMINYKINGYKREENEPNCTVPVSDFSRMCTSMNSIKCNCVVIHGKPKGVVFQGMLEGEISGRIDQFGFCDEISSIPNNIDIYNVVIKTPPVKAPKLKIKVAKEGGTKIRIQTIKALAKLNNLTPKGIVKFYVEKDLPVKIVVNIGSYGKLTVYLRDFESK